VLDAPTPVNDYKWELYNLDEDYSQANDLAAKMPDKLKQMQALFVQEAAKYQVLPLDNAQFARAITPRPSPTAGQTVFTYSGEMPGIPTDVAPNILNKSFTITADVEVPQGGGDGMIATLGGRWGRYGRTCSREAGVQPQLAHAPAGAGKVSSCWRRAVHHRVRLQV
jgi:arylsulfatase